MQADREEDARHLNHTLIQDTGAGGVRIGETQSAQSAGKTGAIAVDNNIIRSGGRIFPHALAILLGQSCDNMISHNDISDHFWLFGKPKAGMPAP
jgi:Pre-toxin domain with VENN motif